MNKYVHTLLEKTDDKGFATKLVTWLPQDNRVKLGSKITLKGKEEEGWWTVMTQSDPVEMPESAKHNSEKWHEHDDHRAHKGLTINK